MTTYTKLRDGSWGVRVQGSAKAGDRVTVTKKSGGSKVETIAKVLWTGNGNGISLCSVTESRPKVSGFGGGYCKCPHCGSTSQEHGQVCDQCGVFVR